MYPVVEDLLGRGSDDRVHDDKDSGDGLEAGSRQPLVRYRDSHREIAQRLAGKIHFRHVL